jgi:hypothetical protein
MTSHSIRERVLDAADHIRRTIANSPAPSARHALSHRPARRSIRRTRRALFQLIVLTISISAVAACALYAAHAFAEGDVF